MINSQQIISTFEKCSGIFRLIPNWVPRPFGKAGKRLRLHNDDYFALGLNRGSIKERWFSSLVPALNGPLAPADEGLSYISYHDFDHSKRFTFRDAVFYLKEALIGEELYKTYGTWPMYAKFFDYSTPLFHHLHLDDSMASKIGMLGKPEAYYFPTQLNNHLGEFPVTYFGYDPDITPEEVKERLEKYKVDDNKITELSRAYRIELGTGWYTPPGVVHAPGSCLTYEPQWNSDVSSVQENYSSPESFPYDQLVAYLPPSEQNNIDSIMSLMDWSANVDPHYRSKYFRPPINISVDNSSYNEKWITYGNPYFSAKETTILPGESITLQDPVAYGCIIIQGFGEFGNYQNASSAQVLRFNQLSGDEYFVSESAARAGVKIINHSSFEPMVILRHFGPNYPNVP